MALVYLCIYRLTTKNTKKCERHKKEEGEKHNLQKKKKKVVAF